MPLSIGVNLRVTGHCNQGGRKYMEDMFSVAFQPTPDDKDLEYAFFGIFDGHGGVEAATFAKEHLMDIIVKQKNFWSDRDEDVLRAIKDGYVNTHYAMWRELDKWPRTASGLPSTAGTTASVAFIRKGKIYIGHVGDSGIILGYQTDGEAQWKAKALTKDHKPESAPEMIRIQQSGGKVVSKSGVPRVVWNRPRIGHKGPVRRSTHIDEIPFLAVARSLGDLWSYNSELDTFVVSPEPDVKVVAIDVKAHRCLIFGTDGLWNMLTPHAAVAIVQAADRHNEKQLIASQQTCIGTDTQMWINPSKSLVDRALERWSSTRLRADNTSVVTLMLDPPGPSRSEVLLNQKERILMQNRLHVSPPDSAVLETVETVERMTSSPVLVSIPSENIERFLSPPVPGISHPESIQRATPSSQDLAAILMENPTNPQTSLPTPVGNTNMLLIDSSSDISQQSASPVPTCFTSERFEIFSAVLERPLEDKSMVTALDSAPMSSELETEVEENLMNSNVEEESNTEEPSPVAELASTEERISEEHEKHENLISLDSNHEDDIEKVETKEDNLGELLSPLEFNQVPVDENLPEESDLDSVTVEPSKKSIQVAEISSSHLSEEGTENSPSTTSTSRAANEVEIITVKKAVRCERVRLCVRRLTKIRPASAIPEQHVDSEAPSTSLPLNSVKESLEVTRETKSLSEGYELKNMLSYARPQQQQCLFSSSSSSSSSSSRSSELIRGLKRRHSLLSQNEYSQIDTGSPEKSVVTINSRFKARNGKVGVVCDLAQGDIRKKTGHSVPTKRRYSAITIQDVGEDSRILDEPSMKRRTRSEDRPNFSHEGNNVIEDPNSRLSWSAVDLPSCRSSDQCPVNNSNNSSSGTVNNNNNSGNNNVPVERLSSPPNTFQRRSLAKKATPVKTIRPPSINGSSRLQQWRGSFGLRDWDQGRNNRGRNCSERRISRTVSVITSARESTPSQRWLRSDTIAATTVKTLRSRNVDINGQTISSQLVHQYGVAKQNRLPTPSKLKHTNNNSTLQSVAGRVRSSSVSSSSSKLKQPGNGSATNIGSCSGLNTSSTACTSNSGIAKRVKSSYTSSSRTLATRSRMKILSYGK